LKIIELFIASDKTQFKFPNQLSKEDRQKIHMIAKDKGIKSQSQGSKFRCLYIFKNELVIQPRAYQLVAAELQQLTAPNISHFENVQDVIDAAVLTASQPLLVLKEKEEAHQRGHLKRIICLTINI